MCQSIFRVHDSEANIAVEPHLYYLNSILWTHFSTQSSFNYSPAQQCSYSVYVYLALQRRGTHVGSNLYHPPVCMYLQVTCAYVQCFRVSVCVQGMHVYTTVFTVLYASRLYRSSVFSRRLSFCALLTIALRFSSGGIPVKRPRIVRQDSWSTGTYGWTPYSNFSTWLHCKYLGITRWQIEDSGGPSKFSCRGGMGDSRYWWAENVPGKARSDGHGETFQVVLVASSVLGYHCSCTHKLWYIRR